MSKRIVIGGYYGGNNLGDDALLTAILSSLKRRNSDLQFTVASFNPEETRSRFQVESVHWREITQLAKSVQRSDLVVVGGGGLFQDYWGIEPQSYFRKIHGGITTYGMLPRLAHLFGKPCMLYAVGVGPLYSMEARQHTKEIFSLCTAITLRDQGSREVIQELGNEFNPGQLNVTADPVFSLQSSGIFKNNLSELIGQDLPVSGRPLIAVSLRYWEHEIAMEEWTSSLAAQLDIFIKTHNVQVIFTPYQINSESHFTDDLAVNRMVADKISDHQRIFLLERVLSADEMQGLYHACDLVLAMRLHAAILALNVGTPMIALSYDPKVQSMMQENGLGQFVLPLTQHSQAGQYLAHAWQERDATKKYIQSILPTLRTQADRNAEIAISLLDPPSHAPKIEVAFEFIFKRFEQMQAMDDELTAIKSDLHHAHIQIEIISINNKKLATRISEMENSRGWRALERLRSLYRKITRLYKN